MNSHDLGTFEIQLEIDSMRENIWKHSLSIVGYDLLVALQGFVTLAVMLFTGFNQFAIIGVAIVLWSMHDICKTFETFEQHFP